mgnify:CR=1 FL=1|jgi:hypothetical protein
MAKVFGNDPLHILFASIPGETERDYWEQLNDGLSYHKGISCLEDGSYLIIEQRQWIEQESIGYPISKEDALKEILLSDNLHLLNHPKFYDLKILYEKTRNTP